MHLTTYAGWLIDLVERRRTFSILFDEHAPGRPDVAALRPIAMRALAVEALRRGLHAHRDGLDRASVEGYRRFAVETDPTARSTTWGLLYELGPGRGSHWPGIAQRRFASKIRLHLQWRRGRRYGL
jgi:hypothetical protein